MNVLPSFFPLAEQPWVNSRTEVGGRRLRRLGCTCGLSLCCAKWEKTFEINGDGKLCKPLCAWHCSLCLLVCSWWAPSDMNTKSNNSQSTFFKVTAGNWWEVRRILKKSNYYRNLWKALQCVLSKITQNVSSSHAFSVTYWNQKVLRWVALWAPFCICIGWRYWNQHPSKRLVPFLIFSPFYYLAFSPPPSCHKIS